MDDLMIDLKLHFKPNIERITSMPYPDAMTNSNAAIQVLQQTVADALEAHGWDPSGFKLEVSAYRTRY